MKICALDTCNNLTNSKFCSRSCAASYNNKGKRRNLNWCKANFPAKEPRPTRLELRGIPKTVVNGIEVACLVKFLDCSNCGNLFASRKSSAKHYAKCCSEYCNQEIRRRNAFGIKSHIYSNVKMDSKWEVLFAQHLDSLNIKWERPTFICWIDAKGKLRRYYPDFFLPEFNLYVDPKNKLVAAKQKEKISSILKMYDNIVIASLDELLLMNWPGRRDSNPHVSS